MTKKKAPKPLTESTDDEPTCLQQAEEVYRKLIDKLHGQLDDGDVNTTLLRDSAGVIRAGATLDGEKRKAAKEARQQFDAFNHDSVVAWARTVSPSERRTLTAAIIGIDQKGGILG